MQSEVLVLDPPNMQPFITRESSSQQVGGESHLDLDRGRRVLEGRGSSHEYSAAPDDIRPVPHRLSCRLFSQR